MPSTSAPAAPPRCSRAATARWRPGRRRATGCGPRGRATSAHFNDAENMERRTEELAAERNKPACVIMEAAMMNLGVVLPEDGYLEAVREIARRHGVVLIFDEVKCGLTIAAGGGVERFGV